MAHGQSVGGTIGRYALHLPRLGWVCRSPYSPELNPAERVTLVLEALARGNHAEVGRLGRTCPRKTYTANDDAFVERLAASFDATAGACADLGHVAGKLLVLTLLS